ncbi:hypothetical protein [Desulfofustis limnaeus]|uniref:Uncharacterized protein n=1 Tax=Desulfofustis limnaeus TaxID=2740163 RepID=A0ABM7W6M4_9BACT|nr:hypothetical protein [Desulfofustis limnaeus]MDX9894996.1 hypothetical protein [Desulfofustis sp.]BDD86575.1 hypothetical protein DPPLL_09400 [Desulfofustis limnaeus]
MKTIASRFMLGTSLVFGGLIGVWACAALIGGLRQTGWQVSELLRQYMIATGMIQPFHTLVDFYSHIKGVEYLICVAFFVAFPLFYRYVNEERKQVHTER